MTRLCLCFRAADQRAVCAGAGVLRIPPQNTIVDQFFAPSLTCATPCWHDIKPGVTTRGEALDRLAAMDWLSPLDPPPCIVTGCTVYKYAINGDPAHSVLIRIDQEIVSKITVQSPGMTLGDLWLAQGAPNLSSSLSYSAVQAYFTVQTAWQFPELRLDTLIEAVCPPTFSSLLRQPLDSVILQQQFQRLSHIDIAETRHNLHHVCHR